MPVLSTGTTFNATEQITSTKLNNIANAADFTDTSGNAVNSASTTGTCVNGGGLEVTSGGQLQVKDDDIDFVKLSDDNALTGGRFGIMNIVYPVGSVFIGVVSTNPDTLLFGGTSLTTWAAFGEGKVLVGIDSSDTDFDTVEETGGAKTHTLSDSEVPVRDHKHFVSKSGEVSFSVGEVTSTTTVAAYADNGSESYNFRKTSPEADADVGLTSNPTTSPSASAHNNVQPYIVVYMWKRTA